jgi:hypothetical protein
MNHGTHSRHVFIEVANCTCDTCGAPAQYGWFLGRVGRCYCPTHAPQAMVERYHAYRLLPRAGCIYCDNPSEPGPWGR